MRFQFLQESLKGLLLLKAILITDIGLRLGPAVNGIGIFKVFIMELFYILQLIFFHFNFSIIFSLLLYSQVFHRLLFHHLPQTTHTNFWIYLELFQFMHEVRRVQTDGRCLICHLLRWWNYKKLLIFSIVN